MRGSILPSLFNLFPRALAAAAVLTFAAGSAHAASVEIRVLGDINGGRDHYCSLGIGTPQDGTCVPAFGFGASLSNSGAQIELVFTYESSLAPADSDSRPLHAIHIGLFDWTDVSVRLFDADSSVLLVQELVVTEPDEHFGQINLVDQAGDSIFVDSQSVDNSAANDSTVHQINAEFSLNGFGFLSGVSLAQDFQWTQGVDAGSGGGGFSVIQCETATPGCDFQASGSFLVTQVTMQTVPEPAAALIVAMGFYALSRRG